MSLFAKIEKLKAEYEAACESVGKDAIAAEFAPVFAAHPELVAVRWDQYTAYFNDGDACTFSVHDFRAQIDDGDDGEFVDLGDLQSDHDYVEDGMDAPDQWGRAHTKWKKVPKDPRAPEIAESVGDLEDRIKNEDVFLAVFGDHATVTVFRDGTISVKECDHD